MNFEEIKKYLDTLNKKLGVLMRELEPNEVFQMFKQHYDMFKPLFQAV